MGKDIIVRVQEHRTTERHGSAYGGWNVLSGSLTPQSVVYSFGVGDDISFDRSLVERYGLELHAFDPTPRSAKWISQQVLPERLTFHDIGIGASDGSLVLFPPVDDAHVSYTIVDRAPARLIGAIEIPVRRLSNIMQTLGHHHVDVLKMDVEGAEYEVLPTLVEDNLLPTQLLVEFHHRFFPDGVARTRTAIALLNSSGYRLISVSPSGEELTFVR